MIHVSMGDLHMSHPLGFAIERPRGIDCFGFAHFLVPVVWYSAGEPTRIAPGNCLLFTPHAPTHYHGDGVGLTNDWLHFEGDDVAPLLAALDFPTDRPFRPRDTSCIAPLIRDILAEIHRRELRWEALADLLMRELLTRLAREVAMAGSAERAARSEIFERLRATRLAMLGNVGDAWSVPGLARQAGLSRSRFMALYRDFFAATPMEELIAARIRQAQFLLTHGSAGVAEIARACGFGSASHLTHVFKQRVGTTPRAYAKGR